MNKILNLNPKERKFLGILFPKSLTTDGSLFGAPNKKQNYDKKLLSQQLKKLVEIGIDKLNVGCGFNNLPEGWLNIGIFPKNTYKYGVVQNINNKYILNFDVRSLLPLKATSITAIYASHFIEHITREEASVLLKRCYSLLKRGGSLRLTTPNLGLWIKKYYENDGRFFKNFNRSYRAFPNLYSKGDILIAQAYGWNHKWLYDCESLKHILKLTGFQKICQKKYQESDIDDIEIVEPFLTARKMESLCIEAVK